MKEFPHSGKVRWKSPIECESNPLLFDRSMNTESVLLLHAGSVPTAGGMVLENCMAFGINAALKRAFPDDTDESGQPGPPSLLKPFLMVSELLFSHCLAFFNALIHHHQYYRGV
jgi:hypothetical protein